jgi:hypothetical protein
MIDADPDPTFHFEADSDPAFNSDADPASQNDVALCESGPQNCYLSVVGDEVYSAD